MGRSRLKHTLRSSQPSKSFLGLIFAAIVTVILWQIPFGNYILYPFTVIAVWFHEMAHGLMAIALGGSFKELVINHDASGIAKYTGPIALGSMGQAMVAAAGPLGPVLVGSAIIVASRRTGASSIGLILLALVMFISAILWIRSFYGLMSVPLIAGLILIIAAKAKPHIKVFAFQFLGVQACVSVFQQINYLFSYNAGPLGLSDTGRIQNLLFAPYWFWAAMISLISAFLLFQSLRIAYR